MSPDLTSRKRTRLEDQLSDIQYIDCNTPDNTCLISTTAVIHSQPENAFIESYQPKNKSPRNSEIENKRQSLELQKPEKINIPKSFTESNIQTKLVIPSNQSSAFASPQSPIYKQLDNSSTNTTPLASPDFSPAAEVGYQHLNRHSIDKCSSDENDTSLSKPVYENVVSPVSKKASPTYENVLTTISITYRSPSKSSKSSICASDTHDNDGVYEDIQILNPEQASVPTSSASLPLQEASQPNFQEVQKDNSLTSLPDNLTPLTSSNKSNDQRPKSLSALEDFNKNGDNLKPSFCAVYNIKSSTDDKKLSPKSDKGGSLSCISKTSPTTSYKLIENPEQLSLTDLSLSEVVHSSTENLNSSQSSISFQSPSKNSLSPNVSPMLFYDNMKTLSQDILTSLSPSVASLLETKTPNSSSCSLIDDNKSSTSLHSTEENENLACLRSDLRQGNPEYLKLTDNNISSNEEDVSPIRFMKGSDKTDFLSSALIKSNEIFDKKPYVESNFTKFDERESPNCLATKFSDVNIKRQLKSISPLNQFLIDKDEHSSEVEKMSLTLASSEIDSNINHVNLQLIKHGLNLDLDTVRPKSINLIEFSPSEPNVENSSILPTNEKRKTFETESMEDENSIYQQVCYF